MTPALEKTAAYFWQVAKSNGFMRTVFQDDKHRAWLDLFVLPILVAFQELDDISCLMSLYLFSQDEPLTQNSPPLRSKK